MASFVGGTAQELVDGHADPETGIMGVQTPEPHGESDERCGHHRGTECLAGRERPAKGRRTMGLLFRIFRVAPLVADVALRSGDVISGLEVIHVPGHTAGSIALRRADGVVFSGDALLGDRRGRLRQPDPGLSLDPDQASASAATLRSLGPRLLLPGHGAPVRG